MAIKELWEFFGGDLPVLISVVSHPLFGLFLICAGLLGIPVAMRNDKEDIIYKSSFFAGWIISMLLVVIFLVAILGDRLSKSEALTEFAIDYKRRHTIRVLSDEDKRNINKAVCSHKDEIKEITVYSVSEPEATNYAQALFDELATCLRPINPWHPNKPTVPNLIYGMKINDYGLFVIVKDKEHPDIRSGILYDAMNEAGIHVSYSQWTDAPNIDVPSIAVSMP